MLLLRKKSILHLESEVSSLLKSEKGKFQYPVKLLYKICKPESEGKAAEPPFKVLFIVPKRYLKKAFKRNLIKRRLREAFRINQGIITGNPNLKGGQVQLCFIYVSPEVLPFSQIERSVVNLLTFLAAENPTFDQAAKPSKTDK